MYHGVEAMRVVGVDGCRGGWLAVAYDADTGTLSPRVHFSFAEVLDVYEDAAVISVDIPIGLSEGEPRLCDLAARKLLGPRRSSVFPAPDPRLLFEPTFRRAMTRSFDLTGKYLSQQSFAICRKVAEVNWAMALQSQDRVCEVHPEVSFWRVAGGRPMVYRKTWPEGFDERRALLAEALEFPIWSRDEARTIARPAQPDDLLDATVVAWTAYRVAQGIAERLPSDPPIDRRGLRMEIVY